MPANFTEPLNAIKGFYSKWANPRRLARYASTISKSVTKDTAAVGEQVAARSKDAWAASHFNVTGGLMYGVGGAAVGAGIGAGNAYLNGRDVGRGALSGGLLGAGAGAIGYGAMGLGRGLRGTKAFRGMSLPSQEAKTARAVASSGIYGKASSSGAAYSGSSRYNRSMPREFVREYRAPESVVQAARDMSAAARARDLDAMSSARIINPSPGSYGYSALPSRNRVPGFK